MHDRHILVTGTSSGIGRALALRLATRGSVVHAVVRRQADAPAPPSGCAGRIEPLVADLADPAARARLAAELTARLAGAGLHALVNNAGANLNGPFEFHRAEDGRALMELNVFAPFDLTQRTLPLLRQSLHRGAPAPRIVNVGSIGSRIGFPWESYYHASKFALLGHSESLRQELRGEGIAVSIVLPGGVRTPFLPKTIDNLREAAARLPPDASAARYRAALGRMQHTAALADRFGSSPDRVARAIERLLDARWPPFRRHVGLDARLLRTLHALLPTAWAHALWRPAFSA